MNDMSFHANERSNIVAIELWDAVLGRNLSTNSFWKTHGTQTVRAIVATWVPELHRCFAQACHCGFDEATHGPFTDIFLDVAVCFEHYAVLPDCVDRVKQAVQNTADHDTVGFIPFPIHRGADPTGSNEINAERGSEIADHLSHNNDLGDDQLAIEAGLANLFLWLNREGHNPAKVLANAVRNFNSQTSATSDDPDRACTCKRCGMNFEREGQNEACAHCHNAHHHAIELADWRTEDGTVVPEPNLNITVDLLDHRIDIATDDGRKLWIEAEAGTLRVHCYVDDESSSEPVNVDLRPTAIYVYSDCETTGLPFEHLFDFKAGTSETLLSTVPSHWDDQSNFPPEDWRIEVENNDTRLGYVEWAASQRCLAAE